MRLRVWALLGVGLGALLSPVAALPQDAPPQIAAASASPADPDIVVTGGRTATTHEVVKQAQSITRTADVLSEPLARYEGPICPGIIGLPRDLAELMVDRIRYDAERVGALVTHDAKCTPNLLVVATRNGQADVTALMRTHGYLFREMTTADSRALQEDAGPVHAWNTVTRHGRHGETISTSMEFFGRSIPVLQEPMAHSKIYLTTRLEIDSGVVMLDIAGINGNTVNQLADYVVMRTLADTKPPKGPSAVPTMLSLFDPDATPPLELTDFDLAYLRRTYSALANMPAYGKLAGVAKDVRAAMPDPKRVSATKAPEQAK
jgi:hypothetical protein